MIARIKRPATIHDVAKRAGVAFKTVSRVLNNEANVTSATQEKVRKAIKALNYSPSLAARVLAGHRSFLIGLLYDTPSSYYIHSVQFGALERCRKAGFRILPGLKNLLQMRIVIDHMIEEPAAQYRGQYRPLSVLASEEGL